MYRKYELLLFLPGLGVSHWCYLCVVTVQTRAAGSSTPPVKTEHNIDFLHQEHRETWYMDHWLPAIQERFIVELNRNDI